MNDLTFKEFCDLCGEIYDGLPKNITASGWGLLCEEFPTPSSKEAASTGSAIFGYYTNLFPNNIMMCYWGFKMTHKFDREHIENVIKHEFEHMVMDRAKQLHKHSEHK